MSPPEVTGYEAYEAPRPSYGHFGRPALNATIAIGTSIVAFFLVPFGVVEFRGFATPKNNVVSFAEASDIMSYGHSGLSWFSWSTHLIWIGLAVAAIGATLLMVLGQQPLKVDAARWIGASSGFAVVIGATMAFMSSMYHVGTGFGTFMGTVLGTEFRSQFWAISPVIVGAASLLAAHYGLQVMVRVSASRDGIREEASAHASAARWALVFMGVVLVVPWAIGLLPDGISDEVNFQMEGDRDAPLFFSAQDVQGGTVSELESHGRLRYARDTDWNWMGTTISLLVAAAWCSLVVGALGAYVGTLRSVGIERGMAFGARALLYPVQLVWIAAGIFYIGSWFVAKPDAGVAATFLPGFWPIMVPIAAYFVVKQQKALLVFPSQKDTNYATAL